MSEYRDEFKLPEWALSYVQNALSTSRLPIPLNESVNPTEHPLTTPCDLLWSVQDSDDTLVGFVGIADIDRKSRHAQLFISGDSGGYEHLKVAIKRMVGHCMNILNLNRVHARVANDNSLCNLMDALGFSREATLTGHAFLGGEYRNVIWFGLLADDRKGEQR